MNLRFYICVQLDVSLLDRLGNNLVLRGNDSHLHGVRLCFHRYGLLHVVVCLLLAEEAYYFVVAKRILFLANCWDGLNKSNHCFVAFGVEFAIVTGFDVRERSFSLLFGDL